MFVDPAKAYSYFKNRFLIKKTSQNWYAFDNPFDTEGEGQRKMAVQFEYGYVKCWRTGWRGFILDFIMQYENLEYPAAKAKLDAEKASALDAEAVMHVDIPVTHHAVILPKGYVPLLDGTGTLGKRARAYLENRNFDINLLDRMGFGYVNEKQEQDDENFFGYIIVPFTKRGKLYYYLGRDFIGNYRKYKNPAKNLFGVGKNELIYNEDALDMCDTNFVTEGWADASTMGKEGVATLGWSLSPQQRSKLFASKAKNMVFLPDLGETEQGTTYYHEAVKTAMPFIGHFKVTVVDYTEYANLGKDANEIGRENVLYKYKHTEPLTMKKAMDIVMS